MYAENRYGSITTKSPKTPSHTISSIALNASKPLTLDTTSNTPIFPITQPQLQLNDTNGDLFNLDTADSTQYSNLSIYSQSHQYTTVQLILLCIVSIIAGVGNNIAFVQMGLHMPLYPAALLIMTTLLYVVIFAVWLFVQSNNNTRYNNTSTPKYSSNTVDSNENSIYIHYTVIAILVVIGGMLSQYSNVFVGGSIQSLSNQLTLPIVTLLLSLLYKHDYTVVEKIGISIVTIGSLCGVILPLYDTSLSLKPAARHDSLYAEQFNGIFWVIMFTFSDIPSALTNVYEDYLFSHRNQPVNEIHYLCWSNIISLLGYIVTLPVMFIPKIGNLTSWTELYNNQRDAIICVFATTSSIRPEGCSVNSYIPIVMFVLCVVVYFYCLAVLIRQQNPIYQVIVQATITPVSAIAFSSTLLQGKHAEPLSHYTVISCVLVPVGIAIYKYNDVVRASMQYSGYDSMMDEHDISINGSTTHSNSSTRLSHQYDSESEMLPLIARH